MSLHLCPAGSVKLQAEKLILSVWNVYTKLSVKTRTAAVARFLGTIEVEDGDSKSTVSAQR